MMSTWYHRVRSAHGIPPTQLSSDRGGRVEVRASLRQVGEKRREQAPGQRWLFLPPARLPCGRPTRLRVTDSGSHRGTTDRRSGRSVSEDLVRRARRSNLGWARRTPRPARPYHPGISARRLRRDDPVELCRRLGKGRIALVCADTAPRALSHRRPASAPSSPPRGVLRTRHIRAVPLPRTDVTTLPWRDPHRPNEKIRPGAMGTMCWLADSRPHCPSMRRRGGQRPARLWPRRAANLGSEPLARPTRPGGRAAKQLRSRFKTPDSVDCPGRRSPGPAGWVGAETATSGDSSAGRSHDRVTAGPGCAWSPGAGRRWPDITNRQAVTAPDHPEREGDRFAPLPRLWDAGFRATGPGPMEVSQQQGRKVGCGWCSPGSGDAPLVTHIQQ